MRRLSSALGTSRLVAQSTLEVRGLASTVSLNHRFGLSFPQIKRSARCFSSEVDKDAEIANTSVTSTAAQNEVLIEETETIKSAPVKHEFKSETSKLLEIVAHSLYTDREVFVRELISNASDALEKIRHLQLKNEEYDDKYLDLEIHISTDDKKKTITLQDFGIGMSDTELIENLGTIAHSGTQEFLKKLEASSSPDKANLIGQFGVGFYSCFMAGKRVRVYSRSAHPGSKGYCWTSDGSGAYTIAEAEGVTRGTKIIIELRDNAQEFSKKKTIENIIRKYSNFVGFPIRLNGERINTVKPLWMLPKGSITESDHKDFYQFLSKSYDEPLYHLHFTSDSPLSIRSIFYIPEQHTEKYGMGKMEPGISLFSRKVLIQGKMGHLLPDWLRFIKGVVDCEDVPLHLSREHLQDSELIKRLGNVLTSRILKDFQEQARKDPKKYVDKFWNEFANFVKEGICTDMKWKDDLASLLRMESSNAGDGELVSLDDYVARMTPDQTHIYYLCVPSRPLALLSPYYEGFKQKGVEVLFLYAGMDDFVMQNLVEYQGKRMASVESAEVPGGTSKAADEEEVVMGEKEVEEFSKWMKSVLVDKVSAIRPTQRLVSSPAIVVDHESASFRRMMKFADPSRPQKLPKQRLEINTSHPIIIKLNSVRRLNPAFASLIAEQVFDDALIAAGLLEDPRAMLGRLNDIMETALASTSGRKEKHDQEV